MRLHRFNIAHVHPSILNVGDTVEVESSELVHQVRNVFRLKTGDRIVVFNGTGFDYLCKIDSVNNKSTIVSNSVIALSIVDSKRNNFSQRRKLFLCAAIVKKDKFEWIVEKATELGVTDIIPINAERSEKKALNAERLRKIAKEASEQSGRDTTPMVHHVMGLGGAVEFLKRGVTIIENGKVKMENETNEKGETQIIAFHTEGEKREVVQGRPARRQAGPSTYVDNLAIFIGPEGGWSSAEIDMFHREKIPVVCLGPQILRAETAAIAALSLVVFG